MDLITLLDPSSSIAPIAASTPTTDGPAFDDLLATELAQAAAVLAAPGAPTPTVVDAPTVATVTATATLLAPAVEATTTVPTVALTGGPTIADPVAAATTDADPGDGRVGPVVLTALVGAGTTATASTDADPAQDTTAPNTTAPNTTAPNTTAPNTTAPNTTAPNTTAPNTTAPDTTAPVTAPTDAATTARAAAASVGATRTADDRRRPGDTDAHGEGRDCDVTAQAPRPGPGGRPVESLEGNGTEGTPGGADARPVSGHGGAAATDDVHGGRPMAHVAGTEEDEDAATGAGHTTEAAGRPAAERPAPVNHDVRSTPLPPLADTATNVTTPGTLPADRVRYLRDLAPAREIQRLAIDLDDARVAVRLGDGGPRVDVLGDPSGRLDAGWAQGVERTLRHLDSRSEPPAEAQRQPGDGSRGDGRSGHDGRQQQSRAHDDAAAIRRWRDAVLPSTSTTDDERN